MVKWPMYLVIKAIKCKTHILFRNLPLRTFTHSLRSPKIAETLNFRNGFVTPFDPIVPPSLSTVLDSLVLPPIIADIASRPLHFSQRKSIIISMSSSSSTHVPSFRQFRRSGWKCPHLAQHESSTEPVLISPEPTPDPWRIIA